MSTKASRAMEKPKGGSNSHRDCATKPHDLSHLNVTEFPSPNGRIERAKRSSAVADQSKDVKRNQEGPMVGCRQNDREDTSVVRDTQWVSATNTTEDKPQNKSAMQMFFSPESKTPNRVIDRSGASPDVIPDTPDSDPFKMTSAAKTFTSRSFLSSSAILGTGGRIHKKAVAKKSVARKKRSSSSVVLANELGGENPATKWNSRDENFLSALAETGIAVVLPPSEKSVVNYAAGVKRGSVKGLSPDPKRIAGRRGISSRDALTRIRTKLDMRDERLSLIPDHEPSMVKQDICLARDCDNTEEQRSRGDGDKWEREVGSEDEDLDSVLGVDILLKDGEKVRGAADENNPVECDGDQEHQAFRWSNKTRSNVTIKSEDHAAKSDLSLGDSTLGDILSEIQGQIGHSQEQPRNIKAEMTGVGLKTDTGRDSRKQNCDDISLKETDDSTRNDAPASSVYNAADADLMDILSELKTQFAIAQSPCEKKRQPSPNVAKLRPDVCLTRENIPSDRIPSCIGTTLDGDTALDDIMEELAPRRRNSSNEQRNKFAVRSLKMPKRSILGALTDTNSSKMENEECCARKASVEVDSRHLREDTSDVTMKTNETSFCESDVSQSVNDTMNENDTLAQPRDDATTSIDDLNSTLMRNFLLDDSLESGLDCDFGKLSPFKTVTARR